MDENEREGSGKGSIELSNGENFLKQLCSLILTDVLQKGTRKDEKVIDFRHPTQLAKEMDLRLSAEPTCNEALMILCQKVVQYSVKTGHPHFFNQLYGEIDVYALGGAWLTDALNTVSGSMANMYAINLARYRKFPDVKLTGMSGLPTMCIMTSEKGHYSIKKGAAFMGLGMNNVVLVETDERGRMIPAELERAIENAKIEQRVPIMVNATAGTTVFGAFDPLHAIADICEKHGLWLHVDGAWGASVLLSEKLKYKVDGVERADSLSWNPHKMMSVPLQASIFVTKHKEILCECHSAKARYLFQQDKFYDISYDTGDKSLQCGRKVDVLKLWLMWKAKGTKQLAAEIEHLFHCASYLTQKIACTEGFSLVMKEPECTNVCFWYIPPRLRSSEKNKDWWEKLSKVAPIIKQRMTEQGTLMIGYQPDEPLVNFFRMVLVNHSITLEDMNFVVHEIERLGSDL